MTLIIPKSGGLSLEMQERLSRARPASFAAAQRVPGVTPGGIDRAFGPCSVCGLMRLSDDKITRLRHFESMLLKWNTRINLVSARDAQNIWTRHIADSLR